MSRSQPDSIAILKRGLSREEAAYIVGVGVTTFDKMVEEGSMPKPVKIGVRVLWDRVLIDRAFDRLSDARAEDSDLLKRVRL